MTEPLQNFYALASFVALALTAAALLALAGRRRGRGPLARLAAAFDGLELWAAFALAVLAMFGSLWFSEVAGYSPCRLCWWQRIAMYPLVPLLGLAALRHDRRAGLAGLVLAIAGGAVAAYHYQLEWFPEQASICAAGSLCHVIWFRALGFATIPYLALSAFLAIGALCALASFGRSRTQGYSIGT